MFTNKKQRAIQEIELRRNRIETYIEPLPIDTASDITEFLNYFYRTILFSKNNTIIQNELNLYTTTVGKYYNIYVIQEKSISYEDFWQRYYYRTSSIERVIYELEQNDIIEKKKKNQNKFSWRSGSNTSTSGTSTNDVTTTTTTGNDSNSATGAASATTTTNTTTSTPSLADLIPQRVLSTSPVTTTKSKTANTNTTNSSSNNTRGSGIFSSSKKIIFNDLLPKRKARSNSNTSLSPAVSKDQDDNATVTTSNNTGTTNNNNSQQPSAVTAAVTAFVPPPIQPIILDLHDEDDDDKKETVDATTTTTTSTSKVPVIAINTEILKSNTEITTIGTDTSTPITTNVSTTVSFDNNDDVHKNIATIPIVVGSDQNDDDNNNNVDDEVVVPLNGMGDDGTTKIDIPSISVSNINNNVRIVSDSEQINNDNNIPDDEVDEEDDLVDAAITHVTSSSSMDVVDHIIDNVVEVVPKPKFFSSTTNNTNSNNDDEMNIDSIVDDDYDDNNTVITNNISIENTITSTTTTNIMDVINTMSEVKTEMNNDEVVDADAIDSINISNDNIVSTLDDVVLPDLDLPTVVKNGHQTMETNVIDNIVDNDDMNIVDQNDATSTIVPSMIENLKNSNVDIVVAKQEEEQQEHNLVDTTKNNHLNIIDEVTNLCCNNSNDVMNDDDDTTTNQFTETVMEITNTIISDCIQSTPVDMTIINDTSNVTVDTNVQQSETSAMEIQNDVVSVVNDNNTGITKDVVSSTEIFSNNNSNNLSDVQAKDISETNNNINSQDEPNVVDNEITSNVVEIDKETVESVAQISDTPSDLPTTTEKVGNDVTVSMIKEDDDINATPIDTVTNDAELQTDVPQVSSLTVDPPNNILRVQEQMVFTEPAMSNPPFTDDDFIHAIQNSNDLASSTDEDFPIPSPNETKLDNILEHVVELSHLETVTLPSTENDDIANEIENQGTEGVKDSGNTRDIPIDTSTGHLEEIPIVDDSNFMKEEKTSNDNLSLEPTNGKGVSDTVAALMVELPKQVPTNTYDLPEVNEKAVPFSNTYNVPTESDGAFPVVNPFDEVLSMDAVSKVDSLSTFNETIDSMPLTPDVFQSWETENESVMVNTPMMPELLSSNHNNTDAFDPFAIDITGIATIPKEDLSEPIVTTTKTDSSITGDIETINTSTTHDDKPNSEYSSSLFSNDEMEKAPAIETTETHEATSTESETTTEAMQATMESVNKMIDDVFNIESNERNGFDSEDNSNVTSVLLTVEQTVKDIVEPDPDVATLQTTEIRSKGDMDDIKQPMDDTSVKNDSSSGFSAIGKIIRSLSSDSTKVTTVSEKAPAIGLGRRFGELFGSKKRKQSIEEDESLETLDGFHSPKIAKHTCFLDDSKVNSVPVDLSIDSVFKHSDISQEIEESAVPDPIDIQGFKSISDKLEDITLQGEGMESTEPTSNIQTGLSEVVVGKGLKVEEVTKTVVQDGTDSRSVTPVTSNVDLTLMERNVDVEELDRPNGIGLESHRSPFRFVLIIMIGIVISIVGKYWPSITMMTSPVIDDLCGPVKPGWSSTDYPNNTSIIIEEAPYWVPKIRSNDNSRTNWKHHVFQIVCGTNRTRTVLRLTPANVKQQLYYFELWEATDNDDDVQINMQKNTEPLIPKMKIRSVQVLPTTPNQIEIVRPRGKIEIYPSYWSKK